jgi:cytoskeletal protein RodZ
MNDLGPRLKRAREARGVSLRDIATRTKISVSALEALERGDVSKLPGGIFGRAFVRAYAAEVGLDADDVVKDFVVHLDEAERVAAERGAIRAEITEDDRAFLERQQRAVSVMRIAVGCLVVAAVAVLVWQVRSVWGGIPEPAATPETPVARELLPPPTGAPQPVALPEPAPSQNRPSDAAETTAVTPQVSKAIVVEAEISEEAWVFVQADGARVMSELLHVGDRRRVEAERVLFLDIGNVGGFRWTINGKPARSLGRSGVHLRVTLTPENLNDYLQ